MGMTAALATLAATSLAGGVASYASGKKQASAMEQQARQQQRMYQAQLNEQRNAAILEGQNIADQVAKINAGGNDSYADDPFNRKRQNKRLTGASTQLGIY